jgi:hypothetical protein
LFFFVKEKVYSISHQMTQTTLFCLKLPIDRVDLIGAEIDRQHPVVTHQRQEMPTIMHHHPMIILGMNS